jgi:hypothetical protein
MFEQDPYSRVVEIRTTRSWVSVGGIDVRTLTIAFLLLGRSASGGGQKRQILARGKCLGVCGQHLADPAQEVALLPGYGEELESMPQS